jgi:undecaprenyl-diphosphatase
MFGIQQIDDSILNFIQNHLHLPILNLVMPWLSWLDNNGVVWIFIAVLLLCSKKYRSTGLIVLIALLFCYIFGDLLLKQLIARARPFTVHPAMTLLIPKPTDFSFPSGHTESSFAAATVLFLRKKSWGVAAFVLAALIAFSRLYLYVHYPSDIIGGLVLGIASAYLAVYLYQRWKKTRLIPEPPPNSD